MIIEIEGIDGVGKTTQCELLRIWLTSTGKSTIIVKDLESTDIGNGIRDVLVRNVTRPTEVEMFAFLACKSQLFSEVILPFERSGGIVICDRGIGSFLSYFASSGYTQSFLNGAIEIAINGERPDLTILIDVSVEVARQRKAQKFSQSKFDLMSDEFFTKQRSTFLELSQHPKWRVIDGTLSISEISETIKQYIGEMVG